MKTVTLIDGRTVPSDSLEWLAETRTRHNHVQMLLAMRGPDGRAKRQQYLEQIDHREGVEAGRRLREQLKAAWPQGEKA